jgi:hypothetical protein
MRATEPGGKLNSLHKSNEIAGQKQSDINMNDGINNMGRERAGAHAALSNSKPKRDGKRSIGNQIGEF